jgi:omega-6 fatty acid desaturase (delta-12 desaturase)
MLDPRAGDRATPSAAISKPDAPTNVPRRRSWREITAPYARPDARRAIGQVLNTGLPFLAIMAAVLYGLDHGLWAVLLLAVPAAGLLVRLFIIQHDCGHGSFFKSRRANDLLGRVLGVLTLAPYDFWRRAHAIHHATSGNLDRRGVGDITTLTVREYMARPTRGRLAYRLYRHPLVLFGLGPIYQFVIRHRIPSGNPIRYRRAWLSVLGTNAMIVAIGALLALTIGPAPFLLAYLPTIGLAASIGVWLFYVQHQFENTYWEAAPRWDFHVAAIEGCSFYDLPRMLHWITGYIGYHHIHHLSCKIPNYHLRACFAANPELQDARRLGLLDSLRCARLALWDEDRRKLVSFRHARQAIGAGAAG